MSDARYFRAGLMFGVVTSFAACHPHHDAPPDSPSESHAQTPEKSFDPPAPLHAMGGVPEHFEPYVSLTASDGTGLAMVAMQAHAVIDDPLALTEVHFTFENPSARTIEGRFHVALPKDAALSRLAMKIDGAFQEGEVVEKGVARVAYEDALHFKRDPALLEQAAGNDYDARVFPIQPHEKKEIVLSYTQAIANGPYVLPLRGLPAVGALHVDVTRAGEAKPAQELDLASAAPTADFVLGRESSSEATGLRAGDLVALRVKSVSAAVKDPVSRAVVLVDTSGSRALGLRAELRALSDLATRLEEAHLVVACFDQEVVPVFDGQASKLDAKTMEAIVARGALGASDLGGALSWAKDAAKAGGATRVIVITDGVSTAGSSAPGALAKAVKDLGEAGVERVDAIAVGGIRDDGALHRLVTAGLARDGVVVGGDRPIAEITRRLGEATRSNVAVNVPNARWVYPTRVDGLQTGDEVMVYAELAPDAQVRVGLANDEPATVAIRNADRPLLERAWAEAKIASVLDLEATGKKTAETRSRIIDLSTKYRVVSPYTALVVLETEDDYQRFGVARRGLSDVLRVDGGRVVLQRHTLPQLPPKPAANVSGEATGHMWGDAIGDSFGAGGLGLSGVGEGGGGRGEGIGLGQGHGAPRASERASDEDAEFGMNGVITSGSGAGIGSVGTIGHGSGTGDEMRRGAAGGRLGGAHMTRAPALREGAATVNGALPVEVIRRIVRQNFGRFRLCYESGLRTNPTLTGRITVRFIIGRDGSVSAAADGGSDLPDSAVVSCVARQFNNLQFPQPEGGLVTVTYPIMFSPEGASVANTASRPDPQPSEGSAPENYASPYTGKMKDVMDAIARGKPDDALTQAITWHAETPGDVLALVALGESMEHMHDARNAARAYGSIIDLFPGRADLRRFAGSRLEHINAFPAALALAADTFQKAEEDRPDHPSSHRLLAWARLRQGDYAGAFAAIEASLKRAYPEGRFAGVDRILREDAGILAEAWIAAVPARAQEIEARANAMGVHVDHEPSLRFVLTWETDANDVDFHIYDVDGGHAFYGARQLPSGGELYADVTTGYGPECFGIRTPKAKRRGPYHLMAHYYSRGPMGYGMGKVEIVEHDGKGHLTFEERPFLVMQDRAFVDLGDYGTASKTP